MAAAPRASPGAAPRARARAARRRARPDRGRQARRRAQVHGDPVAQGTTAGHGGMTALAPELLDELAARAGRPDFPKLEAQLRSSGYCARPVRLVGHIETCTVTGGGGCGARAPSPTGSSVRRAATAARPSARRARSATARTPTTSSAPDCGAARASPTPWPSTPRSSSPSRRRASGSCTRARSARRSGAALPAAARRADLPARCPAVLRRRARRERSAAG